jgi:hypothetical protein
MSAPPTKYQQRERALDAKAEAGMENEDWDLLEEREAELLAKRRVRDRGRYHRNKT